MRRSLTPKQTAKLVDVHISTVFRWMFHGVRGKRLASHLVGGRRRIYCEDLDTFIGVVTAPSNDEATNAELDELLD